MEHGRFAYSAGVVRPPRRWPNGARLALWVVPNIEYLRFNELLRASGPRTVTPDIMTYAAYDYGNRVAVWRIMALLDRFNIPGVTVCAQMGRRLRCVPRDHP